MIRQWTTSRVSLTFCICVVAAMTLHAQQANDAANDGTALRERVRARYDIVALQQGVALVPKQANSAIRIIEIRDGSVVINGEEVTGRQLRDRLGADADTILRISYLTPADQRLLAGGAAAAPAASAAPGAPAAPPAPGAIPVAPAIPAPPAEPSADIDNGPRRGRRSGDRVRVMGDVSVARGERVDGDVVAVMGNAHIDGEVDGDLNVVMGNANLGPEAVVTGDLNVVGGRLNRAPGARVDGSVHDVGSGGGAAAVSTVPNIVRGGFLSRLGSLAATLIRIALVALLALALMAFGRSSVERVAERAAADPVRAGLTGFVAQILFVPVIVLTVVVLAVSIVGIPLILLVPFGIVLAVIVAVMGFTGVAYQAGRMLNERFGWTGHSEYVTVLLGVVTIAAITLLARSVALVAGGFLGWPLSAVGYVVEYAAWTLGLGAAILVFPRRRRVPPVPPPIPA